MSRAIYNSYADIPESVIKISNHIIHSMMFGLGGGHPHFQFWNNLWCEGDNNRRQSVHPQACGQTMEEVAIALAEVLCE